MARYKVEISRSAEKQFRKLGVPDRRRIERELGAGSMATVDLGSSR